MDLGNHYYHVARPLLHKWHYCFQYKHLQFRSGLVWYGSQAKMILSPDLFHRNLGDKTEMCNASYMLISHHRLSLHE